MCRLLLVKSKEKFAILHHLKKFAQLSKNSKEYQGHGWGLAYLKDNKWKYYKNIKPLWEDNIDQFKNISTNYLLVHTRSAFKDEGIVVENNMPFYDKDYVFIFNGELQGVRINSEGRIGAEKIFNYIKKINKGNMLETLHKSTKIINKLSRYVKAINIIIADKQSAYVYSQFNEDPDYFTMYKHETDKQLIICSDKYPNEKDWKKLPNNYIGVYQ